MLASRHLFIAISFILFVLAPSVLVTWYMLSKASNQYASTVAFVIQQADAPAVPTLELLGSSLGGVSTTESDMMHRYLMSTELVEKINTKINLRELYSKPKHDVVFGFDSKGSNEDLLAYWQRMTKLFYDPNTGLIEIRALAFTPIDARNITRQILLHADIMVNKLSALARDDTIKYARQELLTARTQLTETREALNKFRNEHQVIDPTSDVQGQVSLLNSLQQTLATALIEADLLNQQFSDDDPRVSNARKKIAVIQDRINEEKNKIGTDNNVAEGTFSSLVGGYETLIIERTFAEQVYLLAREAYDTALSEANRQSRYLAVFIEPTLAQESEYPYRYTIIALTITMACLFWCIFWLIYYSVRDRK